MKNKNTSKAWGIKLIVSNKEVKIFLRYFFPCFVKIEWISQVSISSSLYKLFSDSIFFYKNRKNK